MLLGLGALALVGAGLAPATADAYRGWHHRGHWHHGGGAHFGFYFGVPLYSDPYPYGYTYPPYYYYPPPAVYAPPPAVYQAPPPAYSEVAPAPADQTECREYQTTITVDGKPQQSYGTVCRQPDGTWRIMN